MLPDFLAVFCSLRNTIIFFQFHSWDVSEIAHIYFWLSFRSSFRGSKLVEGSVIVLCYIFLHHSSSHWFSIWKILTEDIWDLMRAGNLGVMQTVNWQWKTRYAHIILVHHVSSQYMNLRWHPCEFDWNVLLLWKYKQTKAVTFPSDWIRTVWKMQKMCLRHH